MRQAHYRTYPRRYPPRPAPRRPRGIFLCGAAILLILGAVFSAPGEEISFSSAKKTPPAPPAEQMSLRVLSGEELMEIGMEDYLVGVVAAEMPAYYHPEALKAQAVAARTYTLRKSSRGGCVRKDGADICTDSGHCQAYADDARLRERWGGDYEDNLQKIRTAVYSTAGEILTYEDQAIDAMYHASSGGHTENSEDVYKNAIPYLRGVESPDGAGYEKTLSYPRGEFVERVNKKLGTELSAETLEQDLEILSRFDSGRVAKIRLGSETFSGTKFRGAAGLPSALFSYTLSADSIVFSTEGHGHAVGMSQSGADYYADAGWDYRQILLHYYTGVSLEQMAA